MSKKDWSKFKEEHDITEENQREELSIEEEAALGVDTPEKLREKLLIAEKEALKNREDLIRAVAELENVRKRSEMEVQKAYKFSLEKMVTNLLPVIDSLEQAYEAAKGNKAMMEGIELTLQLFINTLGKHEVEQIDPQGLPFNPQEHEAISVQDSKEPANTVINVFQKGYKLNERVIRPARVIVSKS